MSTLFENLSSTPIKELIYPNSKSVGPESKNGRYIIAGVGVLLLVAIIVGVVIATKNKETPSDDTSDTAD
jgi:hypothetical protein